MFENGTTMTTADEDKNSNDLLLLHAQLNFGSQNCNKLIDLMPQVHVHVKSILISLKTKNLFSLQ